MALSTKAVRAIIVRDDKILLLKVNPDDEGEDSWDLPGGFIEEDDNGRDFLIGTIEESLGIEVSVKRKSDSWKFFRPKDSNWVYVQNYVCDYLDGDIELDDDYVDYRWIDSEEIVDYPVKDESLYLVIQNI